MNDGETNAAGLTDTQYNSLTGHLLRATVRLNSYYLLNPSYGYNNGRIVNTVEHELGHAIGLGHKDGISVMYPQGSFIQFNQVTSKMLKNYIKNNNSGSAESRYYCFSF